MIYADSMLEWLNDDPFVSRRASFPRNANPTPRELAEPALVKLEELAQLTPPQRLEGIHKKLAGAYRALVDADLAVYQLEAGDNRIARLKGDDEVKACINRGVNSLSSELLLACDLQQAREEMFLHFLNVDWTLALQEACDVKNASQLPDLVAEACSGMMN